MGANEYLKGRDFWHYHTMALARHLLGKPNLFHDSHQSIMRRLERAASSASDGPTIPIERVPIENFRPERIQEQRAVPFILTGFFDQPPLAWGNLKRQCGSTMVPAHPVPNKGNDWHANPVQIRELRDVMTSIEKGHRLSVIGSEQLFHDHPALKEQVRAAEIATLFRAPLFREEVFVGGHGTSSAFHCAIGSNIFVMTDGKKRWVLVDPLDSIAMYPIIGWNTHGPGMVSPIDSDNYSATQVGQYPLYAKVRKYVATLGPGEILWNPSWWWHEVTSLEPTIGVPLRTAVGGGYNNLFYSVLAVFSPFGWKHMVRALVSHLLPGQGRWRIKDTMITDTFPERGPIAGASNRDQ